MGCRVDVWCKENKTSSSPLSSDISFHEEKFQTILMYLQKLLASREHKGRLLVFKRSYCVLKRLVDASCSF